MNSPSHVTSRQVFAIAGPAMIANLTTPLIGIVSTTAIGRLGDATLLGGDQRSALYAFRVSAADELLLEARATVMIDASDALGAVGAVGAGGAGGAVGALDAPGARDTRDSATPPRPSRAAP